MALTNQILLQRLNHKINELAQQAKQYENVVLNDACFDERLFKPLSVKRSGYQAYIDEIKHHYLQLHQLMNDSFTSDTHAAQISYLTDKLVNQISALSRELVTHQTHKPTTHHHQLPLFEKHAQYLGHLRKLEWMKSELENHADDRQKIELINERIHRCQAAIKSVEEEIELFEQSF